MIRAAKCLLPPFFFIMSTNSHPGALFKATFSPLVRDESPDHLQGHCENYSWCLEDNVVQVWILGKSYSDIGSKVLCG